MSIELKKNCRYALLVPTSMGIRLTPDDGQPFHCSRRFTMQATSAESNVASVASYLGLPVKVLTTFVKGSPIARFIKDDLASRHIDYEGKEVDQGNPWGYRHQFNLADSGYGSRGPRVSNDRAGEVGRTLNVKDFDLDRIFGREGVQIVHLSGLIGALSPDTGTFCLELARAAKKHGTRIAFDLNYRASFWKGREKELHAIFHEIASVADILVGNEEDFQLSLGLEGPEAGGKGLASKIDSFKGMIDQTKRTYPNATVFATTLREVVSGNVHRWGAVMAEGVQLAHCRTARDRRPRPHRRRRRLRRRHALRDSARLGAGEMGPVRLGDRGLGRDALDRLRATGRRGTNLEHLARQRPRQTVSRKTNGTNSVPDAFGETRLCCGLCHPFGDAQGRL